MWTPSSLSTAAIISSSLEWHLAGAGSQHFSRASYPYITLECTSRIPNACGREESVLTRFVRPLERECEAGGFFLVVALELLVTAKELQSTYRKRRKEHGSDFPSPSFKCATAQYFKRDKLLQRQVLVLHEHCKRINHTNKQSSSSQN